MTGIIRILLMAVLVLHAGTGWAGGNTADPRSVDALMTRSGMNKQFEQIVPMIVSTLRMQNDESNRLSPKELEEMGGMVARAFDAGALKEKVRTHLQANLAEPDIQAALAWLNSPLGLKITKLEENASTPSAHEEMQGMAGKLTGNAGRVSLTRKLDAAVKATETGVAVAMSSQAALFAAVTSGMEPDQRPSMKVIEDAVKKNEAQIRAAVEQDTLLTFLYTYRPLTDAEIGKYIEFAGSAPGKRYHAVGSAAVTIAMTDASRVLGNLIVQASGKAAAGREHI